MYELLLSLIALPLLAVFIDGGAGIIARRETYEFGTHLSEDFTILVPIWGRMKYLETVEYLRQYGNRILLCTTGNESDDFYTDIERIATENGFRIFRDEPLQGRHKVTTHKQRATSGTIRDRLVRNALNTVVNTTYVIPLDADTTTRQNLNLLAGEL
ncbi:MAG: glycosyltransferase family 2 protein, partial [Candidatus Saccharibacteria bacterium]